MDATIMTFNIRLDHEVDKEYAWKHRKERVIQFLNANQPDIIGFQELLPHMAEDLKNRLFGYDWIGQPRMLNDESCMIFFKEATWDCLSQRTIWLSDSPDTPFTKFNDSAFFRICTIGIFQHQNKELVVCNTHLDYASEEVQSRQMNVLLDCLSKMTDRPNLILGDFNATPTTQVHILLRDRGYSSCFDVYKLSFRRTYHGYQNKHKGNPIDFIYASAGVDFKKTKIHRNKKEEIPLSDHYPLSASLKIN